MELIISNYTKKIKNNIVLNDINIKFESGKIYCIVGHNGSGKTMLLRALCGLIKPTTGKVCLDDKVLFKDFDILPNVGIILNNQELIGNLTGYQNLEYLLSISKNKPLYSIEETLRKVGLSNAIHTKVNKYSLGMKQRINIAQAIFEDQNIILLDEPTNAIDSEGVEDIVNILIELKKMDKIIIIATHDIGYFENCVDQKIKLKEGVIIEKV